MRVRKPLEGVIGLVRTDAEAMISRTLWGRGMSTVPCRRTGGCRPATWRRRTGLGPEGSKPKLVPLCSGAKRELADASGLGEIRLFLKEVGYAPQIIFLKELLC